MRKKIKANSNPTTRAEALKEIEALAERKGHIIPDIDIDEYESLKTDFVGIASNIEYAGLLDSDEIRRAWNLVGWGEYADDNINSCDKVEATRHFNFSRYNGESYKINPNGTATLSRKMLQRNVLDMLEDNDKYMNLDFSDAEEIVYNATQRELLDIYDETMSPEEFKALYDRIFGAEVEGSTKIDAADTEEKKMSLEDIAQEKLDNVEDDFDYVLSGIERLCREDMCQEAIAILEKLSSTLNNVISEIGDNFVEDIPEEE